MVQQFNHTRFTMFILAFGIFSITTTNYGLLGVLPSLCQALNIPLYKGGYLVTSYALFSAILGPIITLFFSRYDLKKIACVCIGVYVISNILTLTATTFTMILIARVIPALTHALFFGVAFTAISQFFTAEKRPKSSSLIITGSIFSFIVGLPLCYHLAVTYTWKTAYIFILCMNIIAFVITWFFMPNISSNMSTDHKILQQLNILKKPIVWNNICTVILKFAGFHCFYTYFVAFLKDVTQMPSNIITYSLLAMGIVGLIGNYHLGTFFTSRNKNKVMIIFGLLIIGVYTAIHFLYSFMIPMIILIMIYGYLEHVGSTITQIWLTKNTQEAATFSNSLLISAIAIGVSIGSYVGGLAVKNPIIGLPNLTLVAMIFIVMALGLCIIDIRRDKQMAMSQ